MSKVTVIGAGNVGATCVNVLAQMNFISEIVLLDIKEGLAEGKALDLMQTSKLCGFSTNIIGVTNKYEKSSDSDIIIITSGIPRKPGMTREELIGTNASIVKAVVEKSLHFSPNSFFIVLSNPMDTMTYLALKSSGLSKNRVIGMGGILDSSRFTTYLSLHLNEKQANIKAMVIGGHGDTTMIPLIRLASINGVAVTDRLSKEECELIVSETMVGGATLTKLIGTSAWYAPGAGAAVLARSILKDTKEILPCCVELDGAYGHSDVCIGAPVVIGQNGVEEIVTIDLDTFEKESFSKSVNSVRSMNDVLKELNLL